MLTIRVPDKPSFSVVRSPKWPAVRSRWLKQQPVCQVCDRTNKLEVHHIIPFHIDPSLELHPTNFITLCESAGACCHYIVGHCAISWLKYDPYVLHDAAIIRSMRQAARP